MEKMAMASHDDTREKFISAVKSRINKSDDMISAVLDTAEIFEIEPEHIRGYIDDTIKDMLEVEFQQRKMMGRDSTADLSLFM